MIEFHEFRIKTLKDEMNCKMGCMACNLGSEMAEHSENIRKVIEQQQEQIVNELVAIMEDAQKLGEINATMDVRSVVEFIEDAGKGAMITMKEKKSAEPIDNFYKMIRTYFLT
ncbi:MAG: TetR family transcriptional regulator C-terminal domain-containing protein [Flavobacteriales bacterium]|nr:TetR family transcriptional regulator C-terminal domain-containing protein [Flavobacteriales bacterium]